MLLHLPLSLSLLLPKQTLDLCVRMEVKIPTDLLLVDPKELTMVSELVDLVCGLC